MAKREIRLQASMLNNIKIGTLDDKTWRLYIEILLMASMNKQNGLLQDTDTLAWYLRRDKEEFNRGFVVLLKLDLIKQTTGGYMVENWGSFAGVDNGSSERARRYRERQKNNNNGVVTNWPQVRDLVLSQDEFTCGYCGDAAGTVDHVLPVNLGGTDELHNLLAACAACNSSKKDNPVWEWFKDQPFFTEQKMLDIKDKLMSREA